MTYTIYPSLAGRVAFISGGASGIGAEIVRAFAANGCQVAFVDLDAVAGEALVAELTAKDQTSAFFKTDVTDIDALQRSIADTRAKFGPVAILVNNAANDERHDYAKIDAAYWDRALNVNLRHHFFAAQAVHPHMKELGYGSIINLGSLAWRRGGGEFPAYATAKAGIFGLTQALARAFGSDNIRVNSIEPGAVLTPRQRKLWFPTQASIDAIMQRQLLKHTLVAEDIARAALFFASDDSRMISCQALAVDGGR